MFRQVNPPQNPPQNIQINELDNNKSKLKRQYNHRKISFSNSSNNIIDNSIQNLSSPLSTFFQKKYQIIHKQKSSFKDLFAKPFNTSLSTSKISQFKKKKLNKQELLKQYIQQNRKIYNNLQNKNIQQRKLNNFEKKLLKQEKLQCFKKIQQLQQELQNLFRQNYRLKYQQKTIQKQYQIKSIQKQKQQKQYYQSNIPYVMKIRNNDLNKLKQNNNNIKQQQQQKLYHQPFQSYLDHKLNQENSKINQSFKQSNHQEQHNNFLLKHQSNQNVKQNYHFQKSKNVLEQNSNNRIQKFNFSDNSIQQSSNFDTFQMAGTFLDINSSMMSSGRKKISIDAKTSTRNKVAFFKQSLVILRSQQLDIAFKRSNLNKTMETLRIILYLNNKTNQYLPCNIHYDYQRQYYSIEIKQKLNNLKPHEQNREVVYITLLNKTDLNSVADVKCQVGQKHYDLWLPACFINFNSNSTARIQYDSSMSVVPDRQFASLSNMTNILPIAIGGQDGDIIWGYLYGNCKFGQFSIKLTWQHQQLHIQTTQKWIELIGFLLHFFK